MTTDTMTPADLAAVTGHNNGGMWGDGSFWIIILFLFAFGWGGNGFGGNGGVNGGYTLASDFATIQRQLSDGFGSVEKKGDSISNGLCDGFYTNAQLINGVNTNIANSTMSAMQNTNAIQSQLAQCCCDNKAAIADVKYSMAMNTNTLQNTINSGFCNTNFNNATNTRDIVDNANANTRAILDALNAQAIAAKDEKIASQAQQINALQLAASQSAQNNYLISRLQPTPVPAFQVPAPYAYSGCGCNCNC